MSENPTDRAAKVRRDLERVFGDSLSDFFDRLEDSVAEAIAEHEVDIRREYSDD
jgi:hypothetical protein